MDGVAPVAILPALAFLLLWRLAGHRDRAGDAAVRALILWGCAAALVPEALGLFGALSRGGLALVWGLLGALLLALGLAREGRAFLRRPSARGAEGAGTTAAARESRATRLTARTLLAVAGLFLLATGLLALRTPPQNGDVLSYQLPRIVQWLRQGHLAFWGTEDLRQLTMAPGLEYLVLPFHALAGSDHLDLFVAWLGLPGAGWLALRIVRQAGGGTLGAAMALVFWVSQPQGLWQATNGKGEMWVALWCLAALDRLLTFRRQPRGAPLLEAAAAIGLAGLTKGTGWFLALGLLAIQAIGWRRPHWRLALRGLAPAAAVIALLHLGHTSRNLAAFGSPWGLPAARDPLALTTDSIAPRAFAVNVAKHLSSHLRTPPVLSRPAEAAVRRFATAAGIDPDLAGSNFLFHTYRLRARPGGESAVSSWLPFLLVWTFVPAALLATAHRATAADRPALGTAALVLGGMALGWILFGGLVRWQSSGDRLQILFLGPAAVAWGLVTGVAGRAAAMRRGIADRFVAAGGAVLAVMLLAVAAPSAIDAPHRSLRPDRDTFVFGAGWTREAARHHGREALGAAIERAAAWALSVRCPPGPERTARQPRIGFASELDQRDYLVFEALGAEGGEPVTTYFDFRTDRWPRATPPPSPVGDDPCAVLCLGCTPERIRGLARFAETGRLRVITDFEGNVVPHADLGPVAAPAAADPDRAPRGSS